MENLNETILLQLQKLFNNINKEQRKLLLYRILIELGETEDKVIDEDGIAKLIKYANVGKLMPLLVYFSNIISIKYKNVYKESLNFYKLILENYKNLANEFKLDSSLELSQFLSYLLWNGYLSASKEHYYNPKGRLMIYGLYSFDVIKGRGVCLDYAELLNNYLQICDKKSSILACKLPANKNLIDCFYKPKIERKAKNNYKSLKNKILSPLENFIGNHAINLIEENDNIYAYDITNLSAFNLENPSTAAIVNGVGKIQIKPLVSFVLSPEADRYNIFDKLYYNEFTSSLSSEEYVNSFEKINDIVNGNLGLIEDAYHNIYDYLLFIDKQTDEMNKSKILKAK